MPDRAPFSLSHFPMRATCPIDASPSLPVLGFAFLVSLVTGILFGAGPAWLSSHAQPAEVLRGVKPLHTRPLFAAAKIARRVSGCAVARAARRRNPYDRSLGNLEHQNFGIATANRYVLHFDPAGAGYTVDRLPGLYRQIEDRFSALPGVTNVGMALYSPLEGDNWGECVIQQGHPAPRPGDKLRLHMGSRQHALPRFHRRAHRARPRIH